MKTLIVTIIFLLLTGTAPAQRICGSAAYTQQLLQSNPSLQNSFDKVAEQIAKATKRYAARDTSANEIINIPVVIHLLYKTAVQNISDVQIRSQIDALNKDFANQNEDRLNRPEAFRNLAADVKIKFCLAQVDPQGNRTNGIIRTKTNTDLFAADDAMKSSLKGGTNPWDNKKYLNIWVCALNSRSLGYATPPGGPADLDGLVIAYDVFGTVGNLRAPFNKGRTATHEVGHWLGLNHIWGDSDCGDDGVEDTPRQKTYNFGTPVFPHVTACSPNSNGDMFMNFMDFSDDAVMNMFTVGQKNRMRALFANGNIRNSFLTSFACDSNLAAGPLPVLIPEETPAVKLNLIKVYPNPVQYNMVVENNAVTNTAQTIMVFNATGNMVYSGIVTKQKTTVNLSFLNTGLYIVRIGEGTNQFTAKFIKQ